ncbi:MAG: hypothetical protein K0Q99_1273 [Clostridia bacterium]|jgi:hypothetical protein|nr:hypothetical protein [Clostridia bacterium]
MTNGCNVQEIDQFSHSEDFNTNTAGFTNSHVIGRFGDVDEANPWFVRNGNSSLLRGIGAKLSSSTINMAIEGTTYICGGADYAEMFETADGEAIDAGYFIVPAAGKKIRKATSSDTFILGISSAAPCIRGNSAELSWQGKYLRDEWGCKQYEEVKVAAITDKKGNIISPEWIQVQPVLNPNWDPHMKYSPRIDRPEWVAVGLLGQMLIRDDGSCEEHGYCWTNDEGIATIAKKGYFVLERISANQILVLFR